MNITETNKKIIQQYFLEMWNKKDSSLVDILVSENYLHHKLDGATVTGRDHIHNVMKIVFESYPDIQWKINLMVAENDLVASYIEGNAKHPNAAHFKEVMYQRIKEGVIVEGWAFPIKN
jgi:predicted SnoaL-like aldol condensation-catalyzing enzyme